MAINERDARDTNDAEEWLRAQQVAARKKRQRQAEQEKVVDSPHNHDTPENWSLRLNLMYLISSIRTWVARLISLLVIAGLFYLLLIYGVPMLQETIEQKFGG